MLYDHVRRRSSRARLRAALTAALAITVLWSTGCGSESEATVRASADLSKLDTGSYATKPQDLVANNPERMARNMEALRLADVVPLPQDVDPALTHNSGGAHPFVDAQSFNNSPFESFDAPEFFAAIPGFVAGFAGAARSDEDRDISYDLRHAVMIFGSDASATAAATALTGIKLDTRQGIPAESAKYPSARITWIPDFQELAFWYPTGKFLIGGVVGNHENMSLSASDLDGLLTLSDKAITVISERLKGFEPTAQDKLAALPVDPEGMLRLTLLRPSGDQTAFGFDGALDRRGALHTVDDPDKGRALFEKTGVEFIGHGAGELVRTRDAAAAETYLNTVSANRFQHLIESPPGLPVAKCVKYQGPDSHQFPYHCYVTYGRYAAEVWSQQQQDVYQRISAQYAILANDK
ncbi:hypothetical protein AB0N05_22060 [Nocardia sp. NPDC051030]|uniref:DUF7373 family lipoprotein n=1 Tax=Nocardia sp. NPDC051030 TaxID=3155162 RepID=UPI003415CF06